MASRKGSPRTSAARQRLIEQMDLAGREISTSTVMYHAALAARRGLSATESKALDALLRQGPLTHAALVAEIGLAPASVTELVDRLERKGYAARAPHPSDKRRVLIIADADRINADLAPLYEPWAQRVHALYDTYTDTELALICEFLRRAAVSQRVATEALTRSEVDQRQATRDSCPPT